MHQNNQLDARALPTSPSSCSSATRSRTIVLTFFFAQPRPWRRSRRSCRELAQRNPRKPSVPSSDKGERLFPRRSAAEHKPTPIINSQE
jgi:hypothetical protein